MKKRYAQIPNEKRDGHYRVENIIEDEDGFHISGYILVPSDAAQVGDIYDPATASFTPDKKEAREMRDALLELQATDKDMARAAEEIIDMLVEKNIISPDDLPGALRAKLERRAALRQIAAG